MATPSTFEESGSRRYESGSRHLTEDPKTYSKSVRSKLSKTISLDVVTQKLKVRQMFLKKYIFQFEEKMLPQCDFFFKGYEISSNSFI